MGLFKSKGIVEIQARMDVLADKLGSLATVTEEAKIPNSSGDSYPVYSFRLGSTAEDAPVVAFVGGVHGVEMVGTQIILSYLETLSHLIE